MDKKIARDVDEMEQEASMRHARSHVTKIVKKRVYSLPSGRKMTVILDIEAELRQNQQVASVRAEA